MSIFDVIKRFINKQFNKTPFLDEGQIDEYAKKAESIDDIGLIQQFYSSCSARVKR